jgi:hypothetical protein
MRSDLTGDYDGRQWIIRSEGGGLFWWSIGKMSGYAGPTLADVLRQMKRASRAQTQLEAEYGELPGNRIFDISRLLRWEHMAIQGRLKITGPHGKGDKEHYRISTTPAF